MDLVGVNHSERYTDDESEEQPLAEETPGIPDVSHDSGLAPRIGEQYQVKLPPLMTKSAYTLLMEIPTNATLFDTNYGFLVGLPISLMWINDGVDNVKHAAQFPAFWTNRSVESKYIKSEGSTARQGCADGVLNPKAESIDTILDGVVKIENSGELHLQQGFKFEMLQKCAGHCMVPGSLGGTWTDVEEASFLLGLYIFGRNLVQVKNFVETKTIGDLLSFYYGNFYRSDRYRRWSECQKVRNRRCIQGKRILRGLRQQEPLSSLLLNLSVERRKTLLELANAFGEGRMLLEEYVFALKAEVGVDALIEAVATGQGKKDLKGTAMEPSKSSQVLAGHPEIPIGKACSKLTPLEITNFLNGGYRLSKARSNDLFWEAVWPRLLARGWHSEQPYELGYTGVSGNSLVFLIPGIIKFSRRKLVKGTHYFDSVSDVLKKVALDPALLELDSGAEGKEENDCSGEAHFDQGDVPDQHRHCYLKPQTPSRNPDSMKFTIVDSSMATGETTKVRELRSLPVETSNITTSSTTSEGIERDSSVERVSDDSDLPSFDGNQSQSKLSRFLRINNANKRDKKDLSNVPKRSVVALQAPNEKKVGKWKCSKQVEVAKGRATRRTKPGDRFRTARGTNPQKRLNACNHSECSTINTLVISKLKNDKAGCSLRIHDVMEINTFHNDPTQEKLSTDRYSSRASQSVGEECSSNCNSSSVANPQEKPLIRMLIDQNIPFMQDIETEPLIVEMTEKLTDQRSGQPGDANSLDTSKCQLDDKQHNMNSRRRSMRNRPPTSKALESVAWGFLGVNQKRKSKDEFPLESPTSPSKHARNRVRITEKHNSTENGKCHIEE
ncbi:hypothetical protein K2173_007811 [Erythroxylum novogranatense]|uniref:SANT domain-containing protein n=1 Tax=Erythroxylum novogranatense TaxID=1862640 RepID=A0AAV8TKT1_9ROSI|nr:hypothetical protein K2173_007811 [Erythroxylum novogranatense]